MSPRANGQPVFPATATELDAYCQRYVGALTSALPGRLVCVLLCGSWARGEARPPESDVDLVIVIDTIDDEMLEVLARVWRQADLSVAEVYGLDEVKVMDRNALEMYTTNAVVLWGHTPFPAPTSADFASDLAEAAESVARYARCAALYPWLTVEERTQHINRGIAKGGLRFAMRNLVALRTGRFPRTETEAQIQLAGTPEVEFLNWWTSLPADDRPNRLGEAARELNQLARSWFAESHRVFSRGNEQA